MTISEKNLNPRLSVRIILCVLSLCSARTQAATFTLGAGSGSEADGTYIFETGPTVNRGSSGVFVLGGASPGTDSYVLINWPAVKDSLWGRTVDACSIFMKPTLAVDNIDGIFACFQIRAGRSWVELQATWNSYVTATPWGTAGAKNTSSDMYSAPVDAKVEYNFAFGAYTPFDITSIARQWDGNDTSNCRGVVLKQYSGTDPTQIQLGSDDNVTVGNRPKIKVVYHEGIDSQTLARRRKSIISLIDVHDPNRIPFSQTKDRP